MIRPLQKYVLVKITVNTSSLITPFCDCVGLEQPNEQQML